MKHGSCLVSSTIAKHRGLSGISSGLRARNIANSYLRGSIISAQGFPFDHLSSLCLSIGEGRGLVHLRA